MASDSVGTLWIVGISNIFETFGAFPPQHGE